MKKLGLLLIAALFSFGLTFNNTGNKDGANQAKVETQCPYLQMLAQHHTIECPYLKGLISQEQNSCPYLKQYMNEGSECPYLNGELNNAYKCPYLNGKIGQGKAVTVLIKIKSS